MNDEKDINWQAVEEAGFAILGLTLHDGNRAWKGFSWDLMDRWHERGWILDPKGKTKSVVLTDDGVAKARELLRVRFGAPSDHQPPAEEPSRSGRLHGWDDEKVYFTTADGLDCCVTDDATLNRRLSEICAEHFGTRKEG
jgi:hypothetical protein